jgi:predicted metal-dependent phosphoesterase TrpH
MIDLHMHSTCSDGTYAPADLVVQAEQAGVTHMSLTDHDTVDGLAEARDAARRRGIAFIGGLEISAEYEVGTMHILGYRFDPESPGLREKLRFVQRSRALRNPKIIERLNELGVDITFEEVKAASGGGLIGRPHFAQVLIERGYVDDRQAAFDKYLAKGRPAYVPKVRLTPLESVRCIREAGGVAVLAHPLQLKAKDDEELDRIVKDLVDLGLGGLECYYRNHTDADTARFLALAKKYDLRVTGGSDYHGTNRPGIALGTGEGTLKVPVECWDNLLEAMMR